MNYTNHIEKLMLIYFTLKTKMMMNWRPLLICWKVFVWLFSPSFFFSLPWTYNSRYHGYMKRLLTQNGPYISHHFLLLSGHVYLFVLGRLCMYVCVYMCTYARARATNQPTKRPTVCFHIKVFKSNNIPYTFDLYCVVQEVSSFVLKLFNGMYHIQKEERKKTILLCLYKSGSW